MKKEKLGITWEYIYADRKNKYNKKYGISDRYYPNIKSRKRRPLVIYEKCNGYVIAFYMTSQRKINCKLTFWPKNQIKTKDSWIDFRPLVFSETEVKEFKHFEIPFYIKKYHIENLKRNSTKDRNFIKHLEDAKKYIRKK